MGWLDGSIRLGKARMTGRAESQTSASVQGGRSVGLGAHVRRATFTAVATNSDSDSDSDTDHCCRRPTVPPSPQHIKDT